MTILKSLSQISETLNKNGFNASISELPESASAVFIDFGIEFDDVQIITARELAESEKPVTEDEVVFYANREKSALKAS